MYEKQLRDYLKLNAPLAVRTFREWKELGVVISSIAELVACTKANQARDEARWHFSAPNSTLPLTYPLERRNRLSKASSTKQYPSTVAKETHHEAVLPL